MVVFVRKAFLWGIAMMRTPDGYSRLEISRFLAPFPWSPITAAPR
jgi:hypothetical protein